MDIINVILNGILEGITEWLPVSSTGHMILLQTLWPLPYGKEFNDLFTVVIQLGAILAVLVLFWGRLWPFVCGKKVEKRDGLHACIADGSVAISLPLAWRKFCACAAFCLSSARYHVCRVFGGKKYASTHQPPVYVSVSEEKADKKYAFYLKKDSLWTWWMVFIACIPTAVLGFLLDDVLEKYLFNALVVAIMLILYGVAFIAVEIWNKRRTPRIDSVSQINYRVALLFGLFQSLAMIPGTSRSGATIIGALLIGVARPAAAEFTFFLAIPTMFGASLLKLVKYFLTVGVAFTGEQILALVLGMVVAFGVSLAVIRFLMDFVKKHDFRVFGYYRILLGLVVLIVFGSLGSLLTAVE